MEKALTGETLNGGSIVFIQLLCFTLNIFPLMFGL